jgi:hypothetical protein
LKRDVSLLNRKKATTESKFTIRFRSSKTAEWRWAADEFGLTDGIIYWQPDGFFSASEEHQLTDFLQGIDPAIEVESKKPETPETLLWSLSIPIPGATGSSSTLAEHRLGTPSDYTRWFATARLYSPWIQPVHGKAPFAVDKDIVQAAFLRNDGLSVVVLALSGVNDTAVILRNDDEGNVIIKSRNDGEESEQIKLLVAVSKSYDIANAAVFYHARRLPTSSVPDETPSQTAVAIKDDDEINPKWYEEWYDGFGYCTWNSLGQNLTEQRILDALKSFRDEDISSKYTLEYQHY